MQEFKCPFLINVKYGNTISCEFALIKPPDRVARRELLDRFCGGGDNYKNCPFYSILDNYYKRKFEDWKDSNE